MKDNHIFITGATGFIGIPLTLKLAGQGYVVHALYRNKAKAGLLDHPNIRLFKGDITSIESLKQAMEGCSHVFHVAGYTGVWARDPKIYYQINVKGSENVFEAAKSLNVQKIVFTSTAGVLGPSDKYAVNENTQNALPFFTGYEASKASVEAIIQDRKGEGQQIVIVNPTRVYGPGLLSESNGVTRMIKMYHEGKWHFLPGNVKSVGNYAYIEDVVEGHILAMQHGEPGERYLLGGSNLSYEEFFRTLSRVSGRKSWMIKIPLPLMLAASSVMMKWAGMTKTNPLITSALVKKFSYNFKTDLNKSITKLNYHITPFEKGVEKTMAWLQTN